MNSIQVLCFLQVAHSLNFSVAAEKLFISQPGISRSISALEQEWGVKLFTRENKRRETALTPAGALLAKELGAMRCSFEAVLEQAQRMAAGKEGLLRIGLLDGERIADQTLQAIGRFQAKYPGVDLTMRRGSNHALLEWLERGTIDCCVTLQMEVEDRPGLRWKTLFYRDSLLLVHADHPLAKREDCGLADFRESTFINLEYQESEALNTLLARECEKAGFTPKVRNMPDVNSQLLLLEAGGGVVVGSPDNMYVGQPRIAIVKLRDLQPIPVALAWREDGANPAVASFASGYDLM